CCPTAPPLIPRLHAPAAPGLDAPSLHDALPTSRFGSFTRTDASTSPCTPGCRPPRSSVSSSSDPFALPSRLPDPSSPPTPGPRIRHHPHRTPTLLNYSPSSTPYLPTPLLTLTSTTSQHSLSTTPRC